MRRSLTKAALVVSLFTLAGCVDDNPGQPGLDAEFVGYSDVATGQTVCGNCHITKQRTWEATAHAGAWETLQGSGAAQGFCAQCHTVSGFGNLADDSTGYFAVSDNAKPFYQDVQCESCHGPGADHVAAPDNLHPLTTIAADTGATVGCAACHSGAHHPFVEEWRSSAHGTWNDHATSASCIGCHQGAAALARMDPDAKFVEQAVGATPQGITCAVCHDPHGRDNPGQLRMSITTPVLENNLCMSCHQRNFAPSPTSSRGAHSPQGPMLLGIAGWIPPGFNYDSILGVTSHGSELNPRLCAGCHVETFTVNDQITGAFLVSSTGHGFKAVPCVDVNGVPTGAADCPDTERRFNACATAGCHATGTIARNLRALLEDQLTQNYIDVLWRDVNANGTLDTLGVDSGLLAQVKLTTPGDFSTVGAGATTLTVGEGVWFNTDLVMRADGSMGVHNPFYAEALLLASLDVLRSTYTYLPAPPAGLRTFYAGRQRALGMRR